MHIKKYNIIKLSKIIILLIILLLLSKIPKITYKKPMEKNIDNCINLKVSELSMGGSLIMQGRDEYEKFIRDNKIDNVEKNEIHLCGNTPYKELTTYVEGNFTYKELNIYGYFVNEINNNNLLCFNVVEWYPIDISVDLCDTYIWKDKIRYPYYVVIIVILGLIIYIIIKKTNT